MSSSLGGKLSVYKGVILLTVLVGMGKGHLNIIALEVYGRVSSAIIIYLSVQ